MQENPEEEDSRFHPMTYFLLKVAISGVIVATVSSLGRKNAVVAGLLTSLPIISLLSIGFLYFESGRDTLQAARLSTNIGLMVIPTTLFLLTFPIFLRRHVPFYLALGVSLGMMSALHLTLLFVMMRLQ